MRFLSTVTLATWSAVAVLYFTPPEIPQLANVFMPTLRRVPEPSLVLSDLRKELRDSRASVVQADDVTYLIDNDEEGVLLPNPKDAQLGAALPGVIGE